MSEAKVGESAQGKKAESLRKVEISESLSVDEEWGAHTSGVRTG